MSTASSLLLLTLIVNVQLCSPAPIPVKLAQSPFIAEEPGSGGFELAEVKLPSPERSLSERDFINTAEAPGFTAEPVSAGRNDAVSQESDPPEFKTAAPQEYLIDDNDFDTFLEDAEVDALHVEGESPELHHWEEPVKMAPIIPLEASEDGAEEEAAPGQKLVIVPDAPQEPSESPEEEKYDVLVPIEPKVEEADQYEYVVEERALEEPGDQESHTEEQEDTINIDSSNTNEAPLLEEEQAFASAVPEENTEEEPEEDSGVVFPEQAEDQTEPAAEETQESGSQDPAAIVSADSSEEELRWGEQVIEEISLVPPPEQDTQAESLPTVADVKPSEEGQENTVTQDSAPEMTVLEASEEPAQEDLTILPLKDPDEEVSDDYTGEQVLPGLLPQEPALEEHNEPDERDPDVLIVSATEATSQTSTTVLDPAEQVPPAATEILTGSSAESATSPAPASTDAEVESVPASVEGVGATDVDFKAAGILTGDETGAQANRGALLGAAFFTLLCFIIVGFVGAIVSKKLRRLHDTEVKII